MRQPRRIDIVILSGSSLLSVASAADPIRAANRLSGEKLFDWRILSADGQPPLLSNGLPFPVSGTLKPADTGAALVIVAGFGIAHMAMDDGSPRLRRVDRRTGDLFRRTRHMRAAVLGRARAGDGTGDEDFAVHL